MANLNLDDLYYKIDALAPLITDIRDELVNKRYEGNMLQIDGAGSEANILDAVEEFLEHYEEISHPYNWLD